MAWLDNFHFLSIVIICLENGGTLHRVNTSVTYCRAKSIKEKKHKGHRSYADSRRFVMYTAYPKHRVKIFIEAYPNKIKAP